MIYEGCLRAESVLALCIGVHRCRYAGVAQCGIVSHTVCHRRHERVVGGKEYQSRWGGVAAHLQFVGIHLHVPPVVPFLSEKVCHRACVRPVRVHRYHRIEQNLEVGSRPERSVRGERGGEMASCRRPHYAHIVRVYVPHRGTVAHHADSFPGVAHGNAQVAVRHTVGEYHAGYAAFCEEWNPVSALVLHRQPLISSARTYHHSPPCSFAALGQTHKDVRLSVGRDVSSELSVCRGVRLQ